MRLIEQLRGDCDRCRTLREEAADELARQRELIERLTAAWCAENTLRLDAEDERDELRQEIERLTQERDDLRRLVRWARQWIGGDFESFCPEDLLPLARAVSEPRKP